MKGGKGNEKLLSGVDSGKLGQHQICHRRNRRIACKVGQDPADLVRRADFGERRARRTLAATAQARQSLQHRDADDRVARVVRQGLHDVLVGLAPQQGDHVGRVERQVVDGRDGEQVNLRVRAESERLHDDVQAGAHDARPKRASLGHLHQRLARLARERAREALDGRSALERGTYLGHAGKEARVQVLVADAREGAQGSARLHAHSGARGEVVEHVGQRLACPELDERHLAPRREAERAEAAAPFSLNLGVIGQSAHGLQHHPRCLELVQRGVMTLAICEIAERAKTSPGELGVVLEGGQHVENVLAHLELHEASLVRDCQCQVPQRAKRCANDCLVRAMGAKRLDDLLADPALHEAGLARV
mmetsp:Transcript_11631/g.37311  ORF Transcript_11631/g.37311 Transcript_11631/m.37311 type:complete len:363 (+) Transcript_11631:265-1353(+)